MTRRIRRTALAAALAIGILTPALVAAGTTTAEAAPPPTQATLNGSHQWLPGKFELDSPNHVYKVVFQADCNLVVYHGSRPIWASNTSYAPGHRGCAMVYLPGGTLVIDEYPFLRPGPPIFWRVYPNDYLNTGFTTLVMQNDGNFVEYRGSRAVWATGTNGR